MQAPSPPNPLRSAAAADRLIERANAMLRRGSLAAAAENYRAALALQPGRFEVHANLGSVLLVMHRFAEAEVHLQRAAAMRPDEAPLRLGLARACKALGRLEEAEAGYRHVLESMSGDAEVLAEHGEVLRRLERFDEAEACFQRALEVDARCAAAHYGLGYCLREQGRSQRAIECFERAVAVQPDYIDAHYRLAVLTPGRRDPARLAQLESLQPRVAGMADAQQVRYWFALGRLREDVGAFDAAFAAYAEGNRLHYRRLGLDRRYPKQEQLDARFVERIRSVFSREWLAAAPRLEADVRRVPVFIVGMPRSGTSLVEQMLASHPAVHGEGELRALPDVLEEIFGFEESAERRAYPEVVPALSVAALRQVGRAYLDRAWAQAAQASHVIDKLTGNFLHAGMIHVALPQAKIIHVVRDPRDTCFSCYANLFGHGNIAYSYDLGTLGRHCARCFDLMRHWHALLPASTIVAVRYEELVADTERQLRRLLDFLGLSWDERCLGFHRQRRAVHTVSAGQVRQPVYASSVARWRRFEPHLGPLLDALGGCGAGYDRVDQPDFESPSKA